MKSSIAFVFATCMTMAAFANPPAGTATAPTKPAAPAHGTTAPAPGHETEPTAAAHGKKAAGKDAKKTTKTDGAHH